MEKISYARVWNDYCLTGENPTDTLTKILLKYNNNDVYDISGRDRLYVMTIIKKIKTNQQQKNRILMEKYTR